MSRTWLMIVLALSSPNLRAAELCKLHFDIMTHVSLAFF